MTAPKTPPVQAQGLEVLLPCPFCGGEALAHRVPAGHRVSCSECGAHSTPSTCNRTDEADAAHIWNTRHRPPAPSPALSGDVEAMHQKLHEKAYQADAEFHPDFAEAMREAAAMIREMAGENANLIHDIERYVGIANAEAERVARREAGLKAPGGIYTASRASLPERSAMWRKFRDEGVKITSSWIDEAGDGETECFTELWDRITAEIASAERLVLYAEPDDFPLKGALIECGIALGMGKPVVVCLPGVELNGRTHRPVGSWIEHRLVERNDNIARSLLPTSEGEGGA